MYDCRDDVRSLIQKLTAERDRLDSTIAVLRPLIGEAAGRVESEATLEPSAHHIVEHTNGRANGYSNGHAKHDDARALSGNLARVVKTLRKLGEPLSATEIRRAMGAKAPTSTGMHHLLEKARKQGLALRTGTKGSYKFAAQSLQ